MKSFTRILLVITFNLFGFAGFGQSHQGPHKCSTMEVLEQEMQLHPEIKAQREQFQNQLQTYLQKNADEKVKAGEKRIIPVVFHIIHECGPENISKAQIDDQIRILNEDFSLTNANFNLVPGPFADLGADSEFEFRLATKDDLGNCTDGVVRVYSPKTNDASNANGVKGISHWNSYKYLNVWVVKSIASFVTTQGTVLGYAQFPLGGLLSTDGIVLRHDYTGSIGTAQGRVGRTATHEVGHWLGLRHIWGDADCGSDGVDDTPIAQGPNYGVCWNDFPYNVGGCPGGDTLNGEMFMNYMDYSDDNCMAMFTMGQKEVMDATVDFVRAYLISEANLIATGTTDEDMLTTVPCEPYANFCENRNLVCSGSTITYSDVSYNSDDYTREWEFEGGSPATSTATNPVVTYDNPGNFKAKLTVTNNLGSSSVEKSEVVTISADQAENTQGPFWDRLDIQADFESRYRVENSDNTPNKWEFSPWTGFGPYNSCIRMRNFNNTLYESDQFITPSYDITSVTSPSMLFRISAAERGGDPSDQLRVFTSNNCGQTWILRKSWTGDALITAGYFSGEFVPTETSQWSELAVSLSGVSSQDNVRFRFEFIAGDVGSNNLYIDDIRIGQALSIGDLSSLVDMSVFPNPANSSISLAFNMEKPGYAQVRVLDMLGKSVLMPINTQIQNGIQNFNIDLSPLSAGIYMVELEIEGVKYHKKLVKN
ncbi:MAG: M43 family zinc metalloprotease [Bacteroidia bacterium]